MARWLPAFWDGSTASGLRRGDARSGEYRTYLPDHLSGFALSIPAAVDPEIARSERLVRALSGSHRDLAGTSTSGERRRVRPADQR